MRFHNPKNEENEYTFDDVLLCQRKSYIRSRTETDIIPKTPLSTTLPIISSNMNAVTGRRMAEKLARLWWISVLPQDMELDRMLKIIDYVHRADLRLDTPLTLTGEDTIRDAYGIINKRSHQAIVLVDSENKPISILKEEDIKERDEYTKLKELIKTRKIITWRESITDEEAFDVMENNGISSLPIVDEKWKLIGILTKDDVVRNSVYTPSINKNGELDIAVALSLNSYKQSIEAIINSGVNTIFLDTAHGYTQKMIDAIKDIKSKYNDIILVAWNVMTAEWAKALIEAWADGIKVWIWPWAMCTTRIMTWVWRPQFSAIVDIAKVARENGAFVVADGGVKYPRDLALALAAWGTHVMLWTLLAGTYESPWDIKTDGEGASYKENYGMASGRAVTWRTRKLSKFEQAKRMRFQEGISTSKIYNIQPLWNIIDKFRTWLESAISYSWARDIEELHEKAIILVQTQAGFTEWTPHGRVKK